MIENVEEAMHEMLDGRDREIAHLTAALKSCQETRETWVDGYTKLRDALRKITELVDSESDDPLDDAIRIASSALI